MAFHWNIVSWGRSPGSKLLSSCYPYMDLDYCGFSRSAYEMLHESVLDNPFNRTMLLEHGNKYNNEARSKLGKLQYFLFK